MTRLHRASRGDRGAKELLEALCWAPRQRHPVIVHTLLAVLCKHLKSEVQRSQLNPEVGGLSGLHSLRDVDLHPAGNLPPGAQKKGEAHLRALGR